MLVYSEINMAERLWTIPKERSKNGESLDVYLTDQMLAILNAAPKTSDVFVFSTDGENPSTGYSKAKSALDKLTPGMNHWTLHDLRRTFRTGIAKLGVGPTVCEKCLNHTTPGVAGIYDRYTYAGEMKAAWMLWSEYVEHDLIGVSR